MLKQVSTLGGSAVPITNLRGLPGGMSWGPDDTLVFASFPNTGLLQVPLRDGTPEPLTHVTPDRGEMAHLYPEVLPNGKGVLFTVWRGSPASSHFAVVSLETREITELMPGGGTLYYAATGHLIYASAGTLWAVGFDQDRLALTETDPVPIVEHVSTDPRTAPQTSVCRTTDRSCM